MTTFWRVEEDFVPGSVYPWLEVRTPGGEILHTYAEIGPPALVWYPPEHWQPGEVIRIETLWLFLPRTWGVAVGDSPDTLRLAAAFTRQRDDTLVEIAQAEDLAGIAWNVAIAPTEDLHGSFGAPQQLNVSAWFPQTVHAGQPLNVWLHWEGDTAAFGEFIPFVHLRQGEQNVAQMDGAPRYFVPISTDTGSMADWRQLSTTLSPGRYTLHVGLFDPISGERLNAFDTGDRPTGNELFLGNVDVKPALIPDQTCALIPPACASQVE